MIRRYIDVNIISEVSGGESFDLVIDHRSYHFEFRFPHRVSLEVALRPLEDRINDVDHQTACGIRAEAQPGGLRIWNTHERRKVPIELSITSKLLTFQIIYPPAYKEMQYV